MIDLHTHTIFSDGALSVDQVINNAHENNICVLSITDHDSIKSSNYIEENNLQSGLIFIPGIELSTDTYYLGDKLKIHLLGYGMDYKDSNLNKRLEDKYTLRERENKEYVEELIKKFNFLSKEMFTDFEYGKFGWIRKLVLKHISHYLNENDLNTLTNYLIENKAVYTAYNFEIEDAINIIHEAGGYTVFAHPHETKLDKEHLQILTSYLVENGLDGIETYHRESIENHKKIAHELAIKYDLYETGGSDFHCFEDEICVGNNPNKELEEESKVFIKKIIKEGKIIKEKSK